MSSEIGANKIKELTGGSGVEIPNKLLLSNSTTSSGLIELYENTTNGSNKVTVTIPESVVSDYSLTLPDDVGEVDNLLMNGGTGDLLWKDLTDTNTVYVALNGSNTTGNGSINKPYATIKYSLSMITDASESKPYSLMINMGVYVEDNPIQLKSNVALISIGNMSAIVYAANPGSDIITAADKSGIIGLTFVGSAGGSAIYMGVAGIFTFQNITIDSCLYGFTCNNALSTVVGTTVIASGTLDKFINCTAGSLNIALVFVDTSVIVDSLVCAIGTTASIICSTVIAVSTNIVNTIHADDGAHIYVLSSFIAGSTNAVRIGSTGSNTQIDIYGLKISFSDDYDLLVESATGIINAQAVDISLDRLSIVEGAQVNTAGLDNDIYMNPTYRIMSNLAIGRHDLGNTSSFGDGGSYVGHMSIKTYDGSSYVTKVYGDLISLPNTSVNTAIYIGTTHMIPFYGISFSMKEFINGSIVWEYYDSGTSSWLSFNIAETLNQSSTSNRGTAFTGVADNIYTIRFDDCIISGVKESSMSAKGWSMIAIDSVTAYWIRIRISTTITRSFVVQNVRLKGNYTSIRNNGTRSYHGEARSNVIVPAITSDVAGTAGTVTISISPSIAIAIREGSLSATVTSAVYFKYVLTEDMDTACGLKITVQYQTTLAPSGNTYAIVQVYTCVVSRYGRYDALNAEVYKQYSLNFRATDTRYKIRNLDHDLRMDISNNTPGDMLFIMVRRLGADVSDTFTGTVNVTNINLEYKKWQDGSYLAVDDYFFFEDFSTGLLTNWNMINNATNKWMIGTGGDVWTTYSIYVSNDDAYPTYDINVATVSHIYQESTYPSSMTGMKVTFDWRGYAEITYDYGTVWLIPDTPVVDVYPTEDATHFKIGAVEYSNSLNTQSEIIHCNSTVINAIKGNTYRLVFVFNADTSVGAQPSFVITNIKINIF